VGGGWGGLVGLGGLGGGAGVGVGVGGGVVGGRPTRHPALVDHDDAIGLLHGRQGWAIHQGGPPGHQPVERLLHGKLALGIERCWRFVEQQDGRIAEQRPGDAMRWRWPPDRRNTGAPRWVAKPWAAPRRSRGGGASGRSLHLGVRRSGRP